jgi:hypothetical protein
MISFRYYLLASIQSKTKSNFYDNFEEMPIRFIVSVHLPTNNTLTTGPITFKVDLVDLHHILLNHLNFGLVLFTLRTTLLEDLN